MWIQIGAVIAALLLTIAASLWGLNALHQDYGVALDGYAELRQVFEAGSHLATARTLLASPQPERERAAAQVLMASAMFDLMRSDGQGRRTPLSSARLEPVSAAINTAEVRNDLNSVDAALGRVGDLASQIRQSIQASQSAAIVQRQRTLLSMWIVFGIATIGAALLAIWQYRSVIAPLGRLSDGVRKVAAGTFTERLPATGKDEIAFLAADFNRMTDQLDGFYHQLEQKVAQKSRELVQSERLASVGFLAAGVAHEINNPLGIISGYAEYSLERLRQSPGSISSAELIQSLQIICDEAFRGKDITAKLLSLSRSSDEPRQPVDLVRTVQDVAGILSGLRDYRDRRIEVRCASPGRMDVLANEAEMRQMILNLLMNALEASPAETGRVGAVLSAEGSTVRLVISDNGKGMSAATLERAFEPFYTERKGSLRRGTGLGLSITHAIVQSHGGRIRAESDGPERGSRFIVELPAAAGSPV